MTQFYKLAKRFLPVLFLVSCYTVVLAQERTVTGKVTSSDDGSSVPGVNILEKGTNNGTVSDMDGNYKLTVGNNAVLVFSFVGFATQEVTVGAQSTVNVAMKSDVTTLSEIVVTGYGQQEKRDVTGAMASVSSENFNKGVIQTPDQLFNGKVAGVQITSSSGEPGAAANIVIRGASSFRSGNNPLIVVDGFPLDGSSTGSTSNDNGSELGNASAKNPLAFLNPDDIKSVDILKDASATAIYGSRGANGVIMITTKKGKANAPGSVELSMFYGSAWLPSSRKIDLLTADTYGPAVTKAGGNAAAVNYGGKTDWQDQVFRSAPTSNINVAFGGGNDKSTYRMSIGYLDQQGIVKNSGMYRTTARLNGSHKFIEDKLKMDFQVTVSNTNIMTAPITNDAGYQGSLIGAMLQANPTLPVYQPNGAYLQQNEVSNGNAVANDYRNPVAMTDLITDREATTRILGNLGLTWNITDKLEYKLNIGIDNSSSVRRFFMDPRLKFGNNFNSWNGRATIYHRYLVSPLIENYLTYKTKVADGDLTALLGHSYQTFDNQGDFVGVQNLYPELGYNNITGGTSPAKANSPFGSDHTQSALQSFFARVNYSLSNKYLFTATLRADGSSKFGSNNRYGYFPSFAAGWRLSEEAFIPEFFQDLKLRAGWGITGNQLGLPPGISQAQYDVNNTTGGLQLRTTPNPDIKWEQTKQFNIGIDYAIMNGRLSGTIDYFNKNTTDMLLQLQLAQPAPTQYAWQNLPANVANSGLEFSINGVVVDKNDFKFDVSFNYTYFIDQAFVTGLGSAFYNTGSITGQGLSGAYSQRIANNQSLGVWYMQTFTGIQANGTQGFADNGKLSYVGTSQPKSLMGLSLNFKYKNFDFGATFNARFGAQVYNNTANALYLKGSLVNGRNVTTEVGNNNENSTEAPIVSTRYLENADFIRLNNATLGYNFKPKSKWINSMRIYLTGQNLLLITDYKGYDPEINVEKSINSIPSVGIDYTAMPRPRTLIAGINLTF